MEGTVPQKIFIRSQSGSKVHIFDTKAFFDWMKVFDIFYKFLVGLSSRHCVSYHN